jgi:hypothetical protein
VTAVLDAPFAAEAALRRAIQASPVSLSSSMKKYRSASEDARRTARAALDPELGRLMTATSPRSWLERSKAPEPPRPSAPMKVPQAQSGRIVLATEELVAAFSAGAVYDPALAATIALAPSPEAAPADMPGDSAADSPVHETGASSTAMADGPSAALIELVRELAERVAGRSVSSFGAWRAAVAGSAVADFRPSPALPILAFAKGAAPLPFEQPLAPIARAGACVVPESDATSSIAHLLGVGVLGGDPAIGAALALAAPSRTFLARGLAELPSDRTRARATLALTIAAFALDAAIALRANGDETALRDFTQDAIGAAPPESMAAWWSLEVFAARLVGERSAIYARGGGAIREAILRGVAVAEAIREAFDEDWYRNPRAELPRLKELAASARVSDERALVAWLREAAMS